jgi:hypothetical protein
MLPVQTVFLSMILTFTSTFAIAAPAEVDPVLTSMIEVLDNPHYSVCIPMLNKIDTQVYSLIYHHTKATTPNTDVLGKLVNKMNTQVKTDGDSTHTPYEMMLSPGPSDATTACPNWPNLNDREKVHVYSLLLTLMAKHESTCKNGARNSEAKDGTGYGWFQARKAYNETNMLIWGLAQLTRQIQADTNTGNRIFWTNAKGRNYWSVLIKKINTDKIKEVISSVPICQKQTNK